MNMITWSFGSCELKMEIHINIIIYELWEKIFRFAEWASFNKPWFSSCSRGCCGLDCMMDGYTPSYSTWVISTNYNCPGALNKTFGNKVCFYRLIAGWWFPPRGQIKFKYCLKCQQRSITLRTYAISAYH